MKYIQYDLLQSQSFISCCSLFLSIYFNLMYYNFKPMSCFYLLFLKYIFICILLYPLSLLCLFIWLTDFCSISKFHTYIRLFSLSFCIFPSSHLLFFLFKSVFYFTSFSSFSLYIFLTHSFILSFCLFLSFFALFSGSSFRRCHACVSPSSADLPSLLHRLCVFYWRSPFWDPRYALHPRRSSLGGISDVCRYIYI